MKTEKKKSLGLVVLTVLTSSAALAGELAVDRSDSSVKWLGKKVVGEHHGTINVKEGNLEVKNGEIKGGTVVIDMQSIKNEDLTDEGYNQKLVGHLKSDDFFAVEKFPTAKLELTDVKRAGDDYTFTGNLTIKGITHPVTFAGASEMGKDTVSVEGSLTVDRSKYNVKYGSKSFFGNLGDKVIHDDFTLDFVLVAKK